MVALRAPEHACLKCGGDGPFGVARGRLKSRCKPCLRDEAIARRRAAGVPEQHRRFRDGKVWCPDCRAYLVPDCFWKNSQQASGFYPKCKDHARAQRRARGYESPEKRRVRYAERREEMRAARRAAYQRHRQAVCAAERSRYSLARHARKHGFASLRDWRDWVVRDKQAEVHDLLLDAAIDELLVASRPRHGVYALGGWE